MAADRATRKGAQAMVKVEIRTPTYDEESQTIESILLAIVEADGSRLEIEGDKSCVPLDPVISATTGRRVDASADPEEWARNLPHAYRAGDLVAVIRHDDAPPEQEIPDETESEPAIPDPPVPVFESDQIGHAATC